MHPEMELFSVGVIVCINFRLGITGVTLYWRLLVYCVTLKFADQNLGEKSEGVMISPDRLKNIAGHKLSAISTLFLVTLEMCRLWACPSLVIYFKKRLFLWFSSVIWSRRPRKKILCLCSVVFIYLPCNCRLIIQFHISWMRTQSS